MALASHMAPQVLLSLLLLSLRPGVFHVGTEKNTKQTRRIATRLFHGQKIKWHRLFLAQALALPYSLSLNLEEQRQRCNGRRLWTGTESILDNNPIDISLQACYVGFQRQKGWEVHVLISFRHTIQKSKWMVATKYLYDKADLVVLTLKIKNVAQPLTSISLSVILI